MRLPCPIVNCPYCHRPARRVNSALVYGRSGFGSLFVCENYPNCDAYVQADLVTGLPKGTLARAELRTLRKRAHAMIDPLWRIRKLVDRQDLYEAAATVLGVETFSIAEMREGEAAAFVAGGAELMRRIKDTMRSKRAEIARQAAALDGDSNLVPFLKYLFIESQRRPRRALSQRRYQTQSAFFKRVIARGLVKRIKRQSDAKLFYALTPSGEIALGLRPKIRK